MIAEKHVDLLSAFLPQPWLIAARGAAVFADAAGEHAVIGRGPLKTALRRQGERLVGNRPFRWPQPGRRGAEMADHVCARAFQVRQRILGPAETWRERHVGMRDG